MITVVEQVKYRFHYGFLNLAVPSLYFSLAKRRTEKILNGSDRCSMGVKEDNLRLQELSSSAKRRTV